VTEGAVINLIEAVRTDASGQRITHVRWGIVGDDGGSWLTEPSTTSVTELADRILAGDRTHALTAADAPADAGPPVRVVAGDIESLEAYDAGSGRPLPTLLQLPAC
jgi:hypothetical protein